MLIKLYGAETREGSGPEWYGPAQVVAAMPTRVTGNPNPRWISTSYIERQNLTMRMHMRRFTRLTNAFSKKLENHAAAIALHYMHYNFCKIHMSLRITRAMAAGVTDRLWNTEDVVRLLEAKEHARHKDVAR